MTKKDAFESEMHEYMVSVRLPGELTQEFVSLIPRQRAQVDQLMRKGILTSYSLALDRSRLWATVNANSSEEVGRLMTGMPLSRFMEYEIQELAFHNVPLHSLPSLSMN